MRISQPRQYYSKRLTYVVQVSYIIRAYLVWVVLRWVITFIAHRLVCALYNSQLNSISLLSLWYTQFCIVTPWSSACLSNVKWDIWYTPYVLLKCTRHVCQMHLCQYFIEESGAIFFSNAYTSFVCMDSPLYELRVYGIPHSYIYSLKCSPVWT